MKDTKKYIDISAHSVVTLKDSQGDKEKDNKNKDKKDEVK